jgi:ferredoxin-type protein NapG
LAALAAPAWGHHVLGRPSHNLSAHNATPSGLSLETPLGEYFLQAMVYPGDPQPQERIRFHVYARHIQLGTPYDGEVVFAIRAEGRWWHPWWRWLGRAPTQIPERVLGRQRAEDAIFRQQFTVAQAGDYTLVARFTAAGRPYEVEFPLTVAAPEAGNPFLWSEMGGLGLGLAGLGGGAYLARRRIDRTRVRLARVKGAAANTTAVVPAADPPPADAEAVPARRAFLQNGLEQIRQTTLAVVDAQAEALAARYIRPPGARPELEFLLLCSRCDDCRNACPHGLIFSLPRAFAAAIGTPALDLLHEACALCPDWPCIAACTTGALQPPSSWGPPGTLPVLARAGIDEGECLPYRGPECGVCRDACPVPGALVFQDERPRIDPAHCVGCAACRVACPVEPKAVWIRALAAAAAGVPVGK